MNTKDIKLIRFKRLIKKCSDLKNAQSTVVDFCLNNNLEHFLVVKYEIDWSLITDFLSD